MSRKSRVVVAQPVLDVWEFENRWNKGLSECCDDCRECLFAYFCFLCYLARLYRRTNECCCLFCIPGSLMGLRSKLRTGFRIKGSLFRDFVATTCCPMCAAIQMVNELNRQDL